MGIRVILPREYPLVVGDTFQLFYTGVVEAPNPYAYDILSLCEIGAHFPRYFECTPDRPGEYPLTVRVYDAGKALLGEGVTMLKVRERPVTPKDPVHVLCIGDSLTAGGVWPAEAYRRLTGRYGTPAGDGIENIRFIGTRTKDGAGYEGYGGWSYDTYSSPGSDTVPSPFYLDGKLDFRAYCEKNGYPRIDIACIFLGYNAIADFRRPEAADHAAYIEKARSFVDALKAAYPDVCVRLLGLAMPSWNGGMGTSYGAVLPYCDRYGFVRYINGLELAYQAWTADPAYRNFLGHVSTAGQFDCENAYPEIHKAVNTRCMRAERFQTNGVHPTADGYLQIADAVYRDLVGVLESFR
ncbi:MAG: SGNH/GDSL hydrolase family protein [Eubacteriales bacterium]|jgi:hypothetical protein